MTLLRHIKLAHMAWFQVWFKATHGPYILENEALWRSEYKRTWEPLKKGLKEIHDEGLTTGNPHDKLRVAGHVGPE